MRRFRGYRLLMSIMAITGLLCALALAGCEDDKVAVPPKDSGTDISLDDMKPDGKTADISKTPDGPQWPDIWGPEGGTNKDIFPSPDGYKSSPFGCSADADCFGQKCCPTPWGVKLCAPSCDTQP